MSPERRNLIRRRKKTGEQVGKDGYGAEGGAGVMSLKVMASLYPLYILTQNFCATGLISFHSWHTYTEHNSKFRY